MDTIADRLKTLIDAKTDKRGKFAQLEGCTQISAESWKSFYYGRQRPNPDMIEVLAKRWPENAFWLVTGINDEKRGHEDPFGPKEQSGLEALPLSRKAAARLFKAKIDREKYVDQRLLENPSYLEDDQLCKIDTLLTQLKRLRDEEERTMNELEENGYKEE